MCGCTSTALARDTFKATISCTTWVHCTNCTDPAHHWSRTTCTIAPIWSSLPSDSVLLSFYKMQQCPCTASTNGQWRLQGVFLDCSAYLLVDNSFSSSNQCSVIYPRIPARSRILHPNKDKSFLITPRLAGFHWADALFLPLCCASHCTAIASARSLCKCAFFQKRLPSASPSTNVTSPLSQVQLIQITLSFIEHFFQYIILKCLFATRNIYIYMYMRQNVIKSSFFLLMSHYQCCLAWRKDAMPNGHMVFWQIYLFSWKLRPNIWFFWPKTP